MRMIAVFLAAALLASCHDTVQPIDAQKYLSAMDGPKVPSMQETLLENAKAAEAQGEWNTASQLYKQILSKDTDNIEVMVALAECLRRMGQYDAAIYGYDAALAKDAKNLAAKEGKGLALMAKGDFDSPATLFDEVMQVDKTRWKTLNALGILFTTRNMQAEAKQYFQEALKYSPGNTSVLNNLGLAQALDREYDAAADTLLQAGTLSTASGNDRKRIDMNLALVYAIAGKLDQAKMITEHYYSGAALNNNMGLYAHLANDNQLAKDYLNMALTDSKRFYEKAWQNLQDISQGRKAAPEAANPVHIEESPAAGKAQ